MIKAITFDCWDTLLNDDVSRNDKRKEYFCKILNENGLLITTEKIHELFSQEAKIFQNYIVEYKKTQNAIDRVKTILKLAEVQLPDAEANRIAEYCDKIALEYPPPIVPGVKDALKALTKNYNLAVICNTGWHSAETVRQLLNDKDLPEYFSHLTFSDEAGIAKPHKQIFEYTLDKLGCPAEESVHIGDSEYSDIVGAKKANMKAILFTGINDKYKDNNTADLSIGNYDGFINVIKELESKC